MPSKLTRRDLVKAGGAATLLIAAPGGEAGAQPKPEPSDNSSDERALATEVQMSDDERFSLLVSLIGAVPSIGMPRDPRIPATVSNMSAGYTPGIARLGVPALQSSDASMGVTNPGYRPDDKGATAFPASILVGSSFNPRLAREGGAAIAREARSRGFNIQLAGGIDLQRDVRNGRNYEYYSVGGAWRPAPTG
jgi:beta-glucosidase